MGVGPDDDQKDLEYAVRKVTQMRIFSDEEGKMNLSVKDIQGEILSISQFTLFAQTKKRQSSSLYWGSQSRDG